MDVPPPLTAAALGRARARAQGLVDGYAGGRTVAEVGHGAVVPVLRATVGIQAQEDRAAALAVRARLRRRRPSGAGAAPAGAAGAAAGAAVTAADVGRAVAAGEAVVTWTLRGTRHLHAVDDVRPLLALLGPRHATPPKRAADLGIDGSVGDAAERALRRALAAGPVTRAEVKELLAPVGVDPSGQGPVHVIRRVALAGGLVVLPAAATGGAADGDGDGDGVERYVAFDDVVPPARSPSATAGDGEHDALADLARRHVRAFGPVAVEDLAAWAGLPLGRARAAWRAIAGDLTEVATPLGPRWIRSADAAALLDAAAEPADRADRADRADPTACRLLPGFDALLLGYADRRGLVPDAHRKAVNAGGGLVRPTVLVDGEVAGTWRLVRDTADGLVAEVTPFGSRAIDGEALAGEVADVARFLAVPVRRAG